MSSAPHDGDDGDRPQVPKNRARLLIGLAILLAFVLVFGYIILIGSQAGP